VAIIGIDLGQIDAEVRLGRSNLVNKQGAHLKRHEITASGKYPRKFIPKLMCLDSAKGGKGRMGETTSAINTTIVAQGQKKNMAAGIQVRLCGTVLEVDESAGNWRMAVDGGTAKVEVKHRDGAVLRSPRGCRCFSGKNERVGRII
jgi:hypothetical protein